MGGVDRQGQTGVVLKQAAGAVRVELVLRSRVLPGGREQGDEVDGLRRIKRTDRNGRGDQCSNNHDSKNYCKKWCN